MNENSQKDCNKRHWQMMSLRACYVLLLFYWHISIKLFFSSFSLLVFFFFIFVSEYILSSLPLLLLWEGRGRGLWMSENVLCQWKKKKKISTRRFKGEKKNIFHFFFLHSFEYFGTHFLWVCHFCRAPSTDFTSLQHIWRGEIWGGRLRPTQGTRWKKWSFWWWKKELS